MSKTWFFGVLLGAAACAAQAEDDPQKVVNDALHTLVPNAKIDSVAKSTLPGFYDAMVDGHVIYISVDGRYLIEGNVYDISAKQDLTEQRLAVVRKGQLKKIPEEKRIVFAPNHPRHTVTVFTDVDCPYCRQFHKQIAQYNQLGIAVEYVLYPLTIHPGADKKAVAVWCSADRNAAYTAAMNGQDPGKKTCENPVAELTTLAMSMGVTGTPTIFNEDGTKVGGYIPPDQLSQRLDQMAQAGK